MLYGREWMEINKDADEAMFDATWMAMPKAERNVRPRIFISFYLPHSFQALGKEAMARYAKAKATEKAANPKPKVSRNYHILYARY